MHENVAAGGGSAEEVEKLEKAVSGSRGSFQSYWA
jgi:hypothetical protein